MKLIMLTSVGLLMAQPLAADKVEEIKARITEDCAVEHRKNTRQAQKKDRTVVIWQVESKCRTAHKVVICQWPDADILTCVGDPPSANIGVPFEMSEEHDGLKTTSLACVVNWRAEIRKYCFLLRAGTSNADLTCPPKNKPCDERENELALEPVP